MIPPHGATAEGTHHFHTKRKHGLVPDKKRRFQDLTVSALALGSYLGNFDEDTDQAFAAAIQASLRSGINFFDTAINYRCQRSECVLGRVLKVELERQKIHRSEVVIATKGGFIPFDQQPPGNLAAYIEKHWIGPGIIKSDEVVSACHCLSPAFLQNQIERSLANLQLETIDLYYLHNPEIELPVLGPARFYELLGQAFQLLEEMVTKGRLQYYGLATWTGFREQVGSHEALSLDKLIGLAEQVGGEHHHFRAIQLPYNMAMLEAIEVSDQERLPILSAAAQRGIAVMTSAPLLQGQLLNLPPHIINRLPGNFTPAQKALQFVVSTPSVVSAMVGMKLISHLEENVAVLECENWDLETLKKVCDVLVERSG